jgi:hypothetical protein
LDEETPSGASKVEDSSYWKWWIAMHGIDVTIHQI